MTKAKGPALVKKIVEFFGIVTCKKFQVLDKKGESVATFDVIKEEDPLGVPNVRYDIFKNEETRIGSDYDTIYNYTAFDSNFKEMSNPRAACKDFVNDWIYNRVHNEKFENDFYNGAYFFISRVGRRSDFDKSTIRANAAIKQFLTEIRYQNPDGVKMIFVSRESAGAMYHFEKRLLMMPAVLSGIMMLMRNSFMYRSGDISTYLKTFEESYRSKNETSTYSTVIKFIKMFSTEQDIHKIYPEDPKIGWKTYLGDNYGAHGIFGIRDFISHELLKNYLDWTKEVK